MRCHPAPFAWINQELVSCLLLQHVVPGRLLSLLLGLWIHQGEGLSVSARVCSYAHAAKITHCGHVFCWSCMLHYLALVSQWVVHAHLGVCLVCGW